MGVSVPVLVVSWLLTQQPGVPAERAEAFDIDGRPFSAESVGGRGFLNIGPVPVTSTFAPGAGAAELSASDRLEQASATFGDQGALRASLRIGLDEIQLELTQVGFPPREALSPELRGASQLRAPEANLAGGVRGAGWVHGDGGAGFLWGAPAPAAFSLYGFGRLSVNGSVVTDQAIIQAHALTSGRFSDDESHVLQPGVREGDLELQIIATGLPREIVPNGFVELHYDEVRISTPDQDFEEAAVDRATLSAQSPTAPSVPLTGATSLVFTLPSELPGVGGGGFLDTSGAALTGSGRVFGTEADTQQLGFLSGTGPAFGTPVAPGTPQGDFQGQGPLFDPTASPRIGGGATGVPTSDGRVRANDPLQGRDASGSPITEGVITGGATRTTPEVPEGPDGLIGGPSVDGAVIGETTPSTTQQTSVDGTFTTPGVDGPVTPGTPLVGEVIGGPVPVDVQGSATVGGGPVPRASNLTGFGGVAAGGATTPPTTVPLTPSTTTPQTFGPGVNATPFGPGVNVQPFGPGANTNGFGPGAVGGSVGGTVGDPLLGQDAPQGGVAQRNDAFATNPQSTPGVPATPAPLNTRSDLLLGVTPQNATPAVPLIQSPTPLNAQPATPLPQGVTPLNAYPAGATPTLVTAPPTTTPIVPATPAQ